MGVQAASLRRVRGQSVHTPYVTGMLTHSVENAVTVLFAAYDRLCDRVAEPAGEPFKRMVFYAGLWVAFTVGAIAGGFGESRWSFSALLAPLACWRSPSYATHPARSRVESCRAIPLHFAIDHLLKSSICA